MMRVFAVSVLTGAIVGLFVLLVSAMITPGVGWVAGVVLVVPLVFVIDAYVTPDRNKAPRRRKGIHR